MSKKVVIIGAGYAGVLTAKKLAKKVKKHKADVEITLIDRNPFHTMLTELHEVAANRVDEESITISLKQVFAKRDVSVVLDNVKSIDFENKQVLGEEHSYAYDYVVIAAGSKPTYFGVEGAEEHSWKLWSYEDAVNLREHILNRFRAAAKTTDYYEKRRLLTFHIVGAGFTGVEMAGELAEWVPALCEKFEIDRSDVIVANVDVLDRVVPTLSVPSSDKIQRRMEKMGIHIELGRSVSAIGEDFIEWKTPDGKVHRHASGTVIWAAGIEAADITATAGSDLENAGRGRIKTDAHLRSLSDDAVYVAGDNAFYIPEGEERPIPQMVEMAEHAADTVSHNLSVDLFGKEQGIKKLSEYEDLNTTGHGVMVCVGGRWGAAEVGTDKKKIRLASFFAMFVKHFINMVYFAQVLGWNKIFSYMKHEFFTIRHRRSFVGGHFSNRNPSFVLVILRVWLGAVWVFEAVKKILEGWMTKPMMEGFIGGAQSFYDGIFGVDGGSAATDAASAATGAVGDAVSEALINWNILGLFKIQFVSAVAAIDAGLADFALRLEVPLLNNMMWNILIPSTGLQLFMQISIVLAELIVGLCLMGGLFTTPAAAVSIILQLMFLSSTGLYLSTVWMIPASIACLFGAGLSFGLDYYLSPPLKRAWKKFGPARKWYLYHD